MKKIITILVSIICFSVSAQSQINHTLEEAQEMYANARTVDDYRAAQKEFRAARYDVGYVESVHKQKIDRGIADCDRKINQLTDRLTVNGNSNTATLSFKSSGGTVNLSVSTNRTEVRTSQVPSWVIIESVTSTSMSVSCSPNNSSSARSGNFYVHAGNKQVKVSVSQAGKSTTRLTTSTDRVSFSSSGGSKTITVFTDGAWRISVGTATWGHTNINGNNITLRVDANYGDYRTDYFIIKSGGLEKKINISQDGSLATYLRLSNSSIEVSRSGTGYNRCYQVNVYTDGKKVTATTSANWIDVDVVGGNSIEIQVSTNTSSRRTATITVKAGNKSQQILVSQKGISNCTNCYNMQYNCSTGLVWGIVGYYYIGWNPMPRYGWVQCPVCGGSGIIEN